jgi:mono/diheme cytochrome c family protein
MSRPQYSVSSSRAPRPDRLPVARGISVPCLATVRRASAGLWHAPRGRRVALGAWLFAQVICAPVGLGGPDAAGVDVDPTKLPEPATRRVGFDAEVRPIFEASCLRCHGAERPRAGFSLQTRAAALRGGESGAAIVPGDSASSPLIHFVAQLVEGMEMPPRGQGESLTPEQVGILRAWIDQGAGWSVERPPRELSVTSSAQWISVDGDARQFREHTGHHEGWSGGISRLEWREWIDSETELHLTGRGLYDQGDYGVRLSLRRQDRGFVRFGVDTWRDYSDDTGGYYAAYDIPPPALNRELELERGRAWLDLGLTLPRWPRFTVGYEYQWQEGETTSLAWGLYSPDPFADPGQAIRPGYRQTDEQTHIFKLSVEHSRDSFALEDSFWAELYSLETRSEHPGNGAADLLGHYRESYDHLRLANVLRAEKQLRPWLMISGGYLYSHLEGDGAVSQSLSSLSGSFPSFDGDAARAVTLEQESHSLNANTLLGPWEGFHLSAGVQGEWRRTEGFGDIVTPGFPDPWNGRNSSGQDRTVLDEMAELRFDGIPLTALYASGRWRQDWTDLRETSLIDDGFSIARDFARETDARGQRAEYGVGLTVSPWTRVTADAGYRFRVSRTDYHSPLDWDGSAAMGNGYPAFIRRRDVTGEEVSARLAWRAWSWLKLTLKYTYTETRYESDTDSSLVPAFPEPVFHPGGLIVGGLEHAHSGAAALSLAPWRRARLSGSVSITESHLASGVDDGALLVPYSGRVWGALGQATWLLDERTDLLVGYAFSAGDYEPKGQTEGLPLGIRYQRHGLTTALLRKLTPTLQVSLQYAFFRYDEPSRAGATDYRAHWIAAGLTWRLP